MSKTKQYLPTDEISLFCGQISMILKSGMRVNDGMQVLYESYRDTSFGAAFLQMYQKIQDNGSLAQSIKEAGFFPPYMVNMVLVGELSGKLDDVMQSLSEYYQREHTISQAIKQAILYPACLVVMMAVVIGVVVLKILPVFDQVLQSMGSNAAASSGLGTQIGQAIGNVALALSATVILAILILGFCYQTKLKQAVQGLLGRIFPPIEHLQNKLAAARMSYVVSVMLDSGHHIDRALQMAPDMVEDARCRQKIMTIQSLVEQGSDFADACEQTQIFSPIHCKMLKVAAATGKSDVVLKELSGIYSEEINSDISKILSLIEPTVVGGLAVVIGAMMISIMLPLIQILSSIG